jgi:oxygen-independent coproporphyrinogen-3 oxidase
MTPFSVYLHIPFCQHRCGYCDFNTYAGLEHLMFAYVEALCYEIEFAADHAQEPLPVHSVFFGGGTPSLLPTDELKRILSVLSRRFNLLSGVEITLEANPGSLSLSFLKAIREAGINRLSIGMQSAQPEELRLLERQHEYSDVIQAVKWARKAGFDNVNLDLIFGLPNQSLERWAHTLDLALGLHPDHFSLYALTLEHGTPLAHWAARGLVSEPDPDLAAEMYELAVERMDVAGFQQYEISNWGRRRDGGWMACRHNLQYWRNLPYLGFGAGAHGFAAGGRTANVLSPAAYIQRCSPGNENGSQPVLFPCTPATQNWQPIDQATEIGETMMMGLRLTQEGVSNSDFQRRFGQTLEQVFATQISELINYSLIEWGGQEHDLLRLTRRGRLLGNQVFYRFI